jgi:hypothetical protein
MSMHEAPVQLAYLSHPMDGIALKQWFNRNSQFPSGFKNWENG